MPPAPIVNVMASIFREGFDNVNDLGNASGKEGLQGEKYRVTDTQFRGHTVVNWNTGVGISTSARFLLGGHSLMKRTTVSLPHIIDTYLWIGL